MTHVRKQRQLTLTQISHKPKETLKVLSVDLMGLLPIGRGGINFILAMVDMFSKYINFFPLKTTTRAILNRLKKFYIPEVGKPKAILTDNGTLFTASAWRKSLEGLEIKVKFVIKYHPQANPVERHNR